MVAAFAAIALLPTAAAVTVCPLGVCVVEDDRVATSEELRDDVLHFTCGFLLDRGVGAPPLPPGEGPVSELRSWYDEFRGDLKDPSAWCYANFPGSQ